MHFSGLSHVVTQLDRGRIRFSVSDGHHLGLGLRRPYVGVPTRRGRGCWCGWRWGRGGSWCRRGLAIEGILGLRTGHHTGRHTGRLGLALGFELLLCDLGSGLFARDIEPLPAARGTGPRAWIGVPVELPASGQVAAPSEGLFLCHCVSRSPSWQSVTCL